VTERGLSAAEVAERVRAGQVNRARRSDWADYRDILSRNVLTLFNALVLPAAVALFVLGEYQGAIAVSGVAVINSVIGLFQELRAKRYLDKLSILVETRSRVVRDGRPVEISAGDVVRDDHVLLASGEAVVADGPVLESRFLEVDEALLTGESDPVRRTAGDRLLSGSICVAGEGAYRAEQVGAEAFAQRTALSARAYQYTASPLTDIINLLIKLLSYAALGLCLVYLGVYWLSDLPARELVKWVAATITSMIPQGLVLTATLAFTLGAMHMTARGAIVQRVSAVEAMAAVDVVCTDKTGTLTTNRLQLDRLVPLAPDMSEEAIRERLQAFASACIDRRNKSLQALRTALGEAAVELLDELPFKAQHRYSAVRLRDGRAERVLVLGAPEALMPHLEGGTPDTWHSSLHELTRAGLRALLFAESPRHALFEGSLEGFPLRPLALVALSDELRPEAGDVLEALAAQGIAFKVLSGDNPETVRATVGHLKLPLVNEPVVSGDRLEASPHKGEVIRRHSVFGRVAPQQKVEIVETLKAGGHYVAMIGDGVNDVLPIKRAHLGVAMGEGSPASKTVAGLVLENNDFALLPETLEEGRTIIRNLRRSAKLFLVKNVYSFVLLVLGALDVLGLPFPYLPQQVTLLNWLTIGIPAFIITLSRERSTSPTRPRFLREVGWFALRTGLVFAAAGIVLLLISVWVNGDDRPTQRTLLLSALTLLGVTSLLRALTDGETQPLHGDTKFRWLAAAAIPVYLIAMYWDIPADFFRLVPLQGRQWAIVLAVVLPAYGVSILSDRLPVGGLASKPPDKQTGPPAKPDGPVDAALRP
jgi:cation-transporting ATPase E